MSLGEQQVRHVAQLARLGLTDDEVATFSEQLAEILDYAEQISEVATGDVPPTAHPMRPVNVMREDEPVDGLAHREALAPAPRVADGRFQVPRISGEEPAALAPEGGDGSGEEPSEGARP